MARRAPVLVGPGLGVQGRGEDQLCCLASGLSLVKNTQDVVLLHDQILGSVDLHLAAGPLAEQHAVADVHVDWNELAGSVPAARTDGNNLSLLRLFLRRVRDDDAARGALFRIDTPHNDTIMQWPETHFVLLPARPDCVLLTSGGHPLSVRS